MEFRASRGRKTVFALEVFSVPVTGPQVVAAGFPVAQEGTGGGGAANGGSLLTFSVFSSQLFTQRCWK